MTARVFVDTNVFVYTRDRTEAEKHERALRWIAALWEGRSGRLSWQVLQEYYVAVTRKLDPPRDRAEAQADVTSLVMWHPIPIGLATIDAAWGIEERFGLSWWDALIVAAAQIGRCDYLLSEDLQPGQDFQGVTVVSPFEHEPGAILEA